MTYISICISIAQNMYVLYRVYICIIYIFIYVKGLFKLICHRRSNMLRVSQCCVMREINHNSAKFLFFSFFFVVSPRSPALIHIERVFPIISPYSKFCQYDKRYSKREQFIPPVKRDNILRTIYIYVTYFTRKQKNAPSRNISA